MKKNEVEIGKLYTAKVTNRVVQVRIDAENRHGGWDATNLETGKKVRIQSVQRLRSAINGNGAATVAKKARGNKKAQAAAEPQPAATSAPTVEDVPVPSRSAPNPRPPIRRRPKRPTSPIAPARRRHPRSRRKSG